MRDAAALAEIDSVVVAEKHIAGRPAWQRERRGSVVTLRTHLTINGVVRLDVVFTANAPVRLSPQPITFVLVRAGRAVERLDTFPRKPHLNPGGDAVPAELRGKILPATVHHLHAWADNRAWPAGSNLPVARALEVPLDNAVAAFQFFAARLNLRGTIPPPPHEPGLL